jgi:hypothetical protein
VQLPPTLRRPQPYLFRREDLPNYRAAGILHGAFCPSSAPGIGTGLHNRYLRHALGRAAAIKRLVGNRTRKNPFPRANMLFSHRKDRFATDRARRCRRAAKTGN